MDKKLRESELALKIEAEKTKEKLLVTKEDIIQYIEQAIKKRPKAMIDSFVKEVVLYNDKVVIHYNYIDKNSDGDNPHQSFSFYRVKKSFVIDKHKIGGKPEMLELEIELLI